MMLPALLHQAVHALPDIVLAIDPGGLKILDVNRAEVFGYARDALVELTLDAVAEAPRVELERLVAAADGALLELAVRWRTGEIVRATARAAGSAAAAPTPCVLVVLREAPARGALNEEIERAAVALRGALACIEALSERPRTSSAASLAVGQAKAKGAVPTPPELSLAQYASLCVETELAPGSLDAIGARYGVADEAARAELHRIWQQRLHDDPAQRAEWTGFAGRYREWLQAQQRLRDEAAIATGESLAPSGPTHEARAEPVHLRAMGTIAGSAAPRTTALPFRAEGLASIATVGASEERPGAPLPFKDAQAPELSVDQFAALSVELEAYPDRKKDILAMYGIVTEGAWRECDGHWASRLGADPALRLRWMRLAVELRAKLVRK
jgi:hypothetical protein